MFLAMHFIWLWNFVFAAKRWWSARKTYHSPVIGIGGRKSRRSTSDTDRALDPEGQDCFYFLRCRHDQESWGYRAWMYHTQMVIHNRWQWSLLLV